VDSGKKIKQRGDFLMGVISEIALRMGFYKNRVKLNYLLTTGRWVAYYCNLIDENTISVPKLRKDEKDSKILKTVRINSKPCFNETNKIYEYHAIEGQVGTINWFGETGKVEDKEDRRLISRAIDVGEKLAKADMVFDLSDILKKFGNWLPIVSVALQLLTLAGIYVILNG